MDISAIVPWIPKLAATLLVVLGILIVLEIRAMVRKRKETLPQPKNTAEPEIVTKVHFPDTAVRTENVQHEVSPRSYKKLFVIIPVLVGLFFLVVMFINRGTGTIPQVVPTPTPSINAQIVIYKFGEAGDLELLNYDELRALEPNTQIIVAIAANSQVQQAVFTVNGEEIASNPSDRTPNGELFVSYILKPGVRDYHIAVRIQ